MVAATWGAVAGAIITVGAEVAIAVGGKLSTELIFLLTRSARSASYTEAVFANRKERPASAGRLIFPLASFDTSWTLNRSRPARLKF